MAVASGLSAAQRAGVLLTAGHEAPTMRLKWPLTGRTQEMAAINTAISDPDAAGIVVFGASGVGKSRIAREALSAAASHGTETRWAVGASSSRMLPLGALASWMESSSGDNLQLVRGVIRSLTMGTPGATVVVGVDDVHLLDDLSTFVLHQIVQRRAAKVILTVRDGEPIPPGTLEVWKGGQFHRLDLQPLSHDQTASLLAATLGGPVDPDVARRVWQLTRGNVLYLRNIVEQEVADGRLARPSGYWRWMGDPVIPPGLVELIESRIGGLPQSVSDVVDVLAVGEPIELESLRRITDSAAIEDAETRGVITLNRVDDRVEARVAHPLYGEVRRKRSPSIRIRRLRGLVAAELAASDDRDDVRLVVRRAALGLDSDVELDADLLVRAAHGAVWLGDLPLADRLGDAAIRAGGGPEASFIQAYVLSSLNRGEEADAVLADVNASGLTDIDQARRLFFAATNRLFTLADPDGAKELVDGATLPMSPRARALVDAFLTVYWAAMGNPERARQASTNYVWDELPDLIAARMTAWALTIAAGDAGRPSEAAIAAEAAYPSAIRSYFIVIGDAHLSALLLSGQLDRAQEVAKFLNRRAGDIPVWAELIGPAVTGRVALGVGRVDSACALLGPVARAVHASGDSNGWGYRCQLSYSIALAMRGFSDAAADALADLEARRHPSWRYLDYEYALAKAWLSAAQGAVGEAIRTLLAGAHAASANGQFGGEVLCLQTATQLGDGSQLARLRELEAIVEGPRAAVAAHFAQALLRGDADELRAVSREFENMGDLIAAMDASAHAALVHRRAERRGSALTCSARAGELAMRCGGVSTPTLLRASERVPLTDREREVVTLLSQGQSTRAIAKRLTVSVRTVEGHIYRAM
ncbi:MAG TPA: LuxR C-terminal-related transcriptional regulator, partial [Mycobacterium sp.]|nr:LuxR C-terminal-related transcriptional regulator [Mycobacterium sp.]